MLLLVLSSCVASPNMSGRVRNVRSELYTAARDSGTSHTKDHGIVHWSIQASCSCSLLVCGDWCGEV